MFNTTANLARKGDRAGVVHALQTKPSMIQEQSLARGHTLLYAAIQHPGVVEELLNHGADMQHKARFSGDTPLVYALNLWPSAHLEQSIDVLLSYGALRSEVQAFEALRLAIRNGFSLRLIQRLVDECRSLLTSASNPAWAEEAVFSMAYHPAPASVMHILHYAGVVC